MSIKSVILAFLNMVIRLAIACFVLIGVYRLAMYSYHFGYMIFTDAAREISPGRDITISVEVDDKVMDIGNTLQNRGLIEDAKIFFAQERLSEHHGNIQPGIYTLNTSMKTSEMIAVMAGANSGEEEEQLEADSVNGPVKDDILSEEDLQNLENPDSEEGEYSEEGEAEEETSEE